MLIQTVRFPQQPFYPISDNSFSQTFPCGETDSPLAGLARKHIQDKLAIGIGFPCPVNSLEIFILTKYAVFRQFEHHHDSFPRLW